MHELSIAMSIVDSIVEASAKENASKVNSFVIEVGSLSGVEPEALRFSLESAVKNTILEDCNWDLNMIDGKGRCKACGSIFPVNDLFSSCPQCMQFGVEVIRGRELKIKTIDIEV